MSAKEGRRIVARTEKATVATQVRCLTFLEQAVHHDSAQDGSIPAVDLNACKDEDRGAKRRGESLDKSMQDEIRVKDTWPQRVQRTKLQRSAKVLGRLILSSK